jgi:hypothetical protein
MKISNFEMQFPSEASIFSPSPNAKRPQPLLLFKYVIGNLYIMNYFNFKFNDLELILLSASLYLFG